MMNRRLLDLDDEWKNIRLKNAEDTDEKILNTISGSIKRFTKEFFTKKHENLENSGSEDEDEHETGSNKEDFRRRAHRHSFERSTRWFKGQQVPHIFICTTLWHEEDFEMATMIRSVLKLMKHSKIRREKAQNAKNSEDTDYFTLEMHIFFDNVFDEKEKKRTTPNNGLFDEDELNRKWQENFESWKILNKYVVSFHNELKKGLRLFHDQSSFNVMHALSNGKIIITPYGGRIEYDIAGTDLIIHLKGMTHTV